MSEITRVPLQPIARGALGKLWLGLAASVLVAGGVAWATLPSIVKVETVREGPTMKLKHDDGTLLPTALNRPRT